MKLCKLRITRSSFCRNAGALLLLAWLSLHAAPAAHGQDFGQVRETDTNIASYYYYVQPGAATVQIEVLGTVRYPGLYVISEGTNLGTLLALCGGPVLDVRERSRPRKEHLRLFRTLPGSQSLIYEAALQDGVLIKPDGYPALQTGDVVSVEVIERQRLTFRDVFTFVNSAALIALTVDRFVK